MEPDTRDEVVDFVKSWSEKTEVPLRAILGWTSLAKGRFYDWQNRYGKANEHNAMIPRDHWLEDWEKKVIVDFHSKYPLNGYRRLCYMMIDEGVVAVSPSSVRNVLRDAGLLNRWQPRPSKKGTGFHQPSAPHKHWHTDVSYINLGGTFYYLASVLDGYSRYLIHWELKPQMCEQDIEILLERAKEKVPSARPRIISDNGPQFIAGDFKEFVRLSGMTHVRTSPYYPQSNGKIERWHKSLKHECIRPSQPNNFEDARRLIESFVRNYNEVRLHSALGYITPQAKINGEENDIFQRREQSLNNARTVRAVSREMGRATKQIDDHTREASIIRLQEAVGAQAVTKISILEGAIHA